MRKKIVIASLLKPVNETRMYEKFALSLAKHTNYDIHIVGFHAESLPVTSQIYFHPIFNIQRSSPKRLILSLKFYKILLKLKPQIIIVNSPDLLIVTALYKILFGGKFIYDVLENNLANIIGTNIYPKKIRFFLGHFVRLIEKGLNPFIDHYLLAEQTYKHELAFSNNKSTVIENKYKPIGAVTPTPKRKIEKGKLSLLYTGTIGEHYGIFEAITLAKKLHGLDNGTTLHIIGFCAKASTWDEVTEAVKGLNYVKITGGDKLVSHQLIIDAIKSANVGLLSYHINISTQNRIPTKLYEYMACQLPMVIQQNPRWEAETLPYQAALYWDFRSQTGIDELYHQLLNTEFYTNGSPTHTLWESEEEKLLKLISKISN